MPERLRRRFLAVDDGVAVFGDMYIVLGEGGDASKCCKVPIYLGGMCRVRRQERCGLGEGSSDAEEIGYQFWTM